VKPCTRKLDPVDAEAVAAGAEPVFASDAAVHAAACPDCGHAVAEARALAEDLGALQALPEPPVDLASRVVRLRGFSRRERLSLSLWGAPSAFAVGLSGVGFAMLRLPGLTGGEQVGLGASALLPAAAVFRSLGRWLGDFVRVVPTGLESLASALKQEQAFGLVAALLFVPFAFGLRRVLVRARARARR